MQGTGRARFIVHHPSTFNKESWLRVGFTGSQLEISEDYINTGSLYLCTTVFLPLGLRPEHPFWSAPYRPWTSLEPGPESP